MANTRLTRYATAALVAVALGGCGTARASTSDLDARARELDARERELDLREAALDQCDAPPQGSGGTGG